MAHVPTNSPLQRVPSMFQMPDVENVPYVQRDRSGPPSNDSVPVNLKSWYSTKIFRTVMFFILCFCILGITTALTFTDKMSIENYMNILSSLLFLLSPSPLDLIKSKKK